ncbi:MAG: hypothetical protein AB7G40_06710 [Hyphomonadaceae bacterium]
MKLPIALGIAAAALTVAAASAQSTSRHVIIHGDSDSISRIDANEDGWITRAEAASAYERIFSELDTNNDGRLDSADRRDIRVRVDAPNVRVFRGGHGDGDVRVITGDLDPETEARIEREIEEAMQRAEIHIERAERDAERAAERAERLAERAAERAERDAERAERHVQRFRDGDRDVIIIRSGDGEGGSWTSLEGAVAPVPPIPPVPPVPAVPFMMLIANSEEADRNGDGALSREEFVAQHLRFFDASDANGDGRVRFEPPAPPPEPPAPPAPPEPPRRR